MLHWSKNNLKTDRQRQLRLKLLKYSYELKLSHVGSCLTMIDIIDAIYSLKKEKDRFVLSNGHAGMALYTVLIDLGIMPERFFYSKKFNIHPDRYENYGIWVSTGSLGLGVTVALGMAVASPLKTVYCCLSDGESAEGSVWESIRVAVEKNVTNLVFVFNINGYGAYGATDKSMLLKRLEGFGLEVTTVNGHDIAKLEEAFFRKSSKVGAICAITKSEQFDFLVGVDAHYKVMSAEDYELAVKEVNEN